MSEFWRCVDDLGISLYMVVEGGRKEGGKEKKISFSVKTTTFPDFVDIS